MNPIRTVLVAFHPRLGAESRSLPLGWRTDSIRIGARGLLRPNASIRMTEYRYELDHGTVTEAYDILREGVEQTWTLHRRPTTHGDVVVTGVITTDLECSDRTEAHRPLQFCERSRPILEYGRAFAIDARGVRTPIRTQFDGERIRIRVPQAIVDQASFPLTIDPLTSTVAITQPDDFLDHTIISGRGTTSRRVIIGYSRRFPLLDFDAFAVATNRNFQNSAVRFSDITTGWDTTRISAACCGGPDAWVLGIQRSFPSGTERVRTYVQQMSSTVLNGGTTIANPISPASNQTFASIGGSWTQ